MTEGRVDECTLNRVGSRQFCDYKQTQRLQSESAISCVVTLVRNEVNWHVHVYEGVSTRARVRACVRACVRVCVHRCVWCVCVCLWLVCVSVACVC